jgi:hypothetical protein
MAGTADQPRPTAEPAQASVTPGRAETKAVVPQVQKGEILQVDLMRDLQLEGPEYLP